MDSDSRQERLISFDRLCSSYISLLTNHGLASLMIIAANVVARISACDLVISPTVCRIMKSWLSLAGMTILDIC